MRVDDDAHPNKKRMDHHVVIDPTRLRIPDEGRIGIWRGKARASPEESDEILRATPVVVSGGLP